MNFGQTLWNFLSASFSLIIEHVYHVYLGIAEPTKKVVRVNLIAEGKNGNCATVRRVTMDPPSGEVAFTSGGSLTTMFGPTDASAAGNMFDIEPNVHLLITGFDVNLDSAGSTEIIEVYYRLGTVLGCDTSPIGWILLGSDTVVSAGRDNRTPVKVGGVVLQPGRIYGFFVTINP